MYSGHFLLCGLSVWTMEGVCRISGYTVYVKSDPTIEYTIPHLSDVESAMPI